MIQVLPGLSPLERLIHARITEIGPLTVRDYMELALYHPQYGYYAKPEATYVGHRTSDI